MFDRVVITDQVNTVIKPQPDILFAVEEDVEYIIGLQTFFYTELLDEIPFLINNIATIQVSGKSYMIFVNHCGSGNIHLGDLVKRR